MLVKINKILIVLLLLIEVNFFSLFYFPSFISNYSNYLVKYLSLFLIIIMLLINLIFSNSLHSKLTFGIPIFFLLASVVIITIFSSYHYSQTILGTGRLSYYYFIIMLYYFLLYYFFSTKNIHFLASTIRLIGVIYSGILIIQILLYLKTGTFFLNTSSTGLNLSSNILDNDTTIFISGIPRIQQPADFIMFSFLITNIEMSNKKQRISFKNIIFYVLQLSYLLFIAQTRMYIILSALIIILLVLYKINSRKRIFLGILMLVGIGIFHKYILYKFGFFSENRSASTLIRFDELQYYIPQIFSNHGFGIGFADDMEYYFLNHGTFYNADVSSFYFDDIGIMGNMAQLGILGIMSIIVLIYYLMNFYLKSNNKIIILFIYLYLFVTSISLSVLNVQRIIYLPLTLYFVTSLFKQGNNNNDVL